MKTNLQDLIAELEFMHVFISDGRLDPLNVEFLDIPGDESNEPYIERALQLIGSAQDNLEQLHLMTKESKQ